MKKIILLKHRALKINVVIKNNHLHFLKRKKRFRIKINKIFDLKQYLLFLIMRSHLFKIMMINLIYHHQFEKIFLMIKAKN